MGQENLHSDAGQALDVVLRRALPDPRHATRRSVLHHALDLFNAHGIEAATIDDLRRACGQSVGTIYHHFKNKEGVVAALFFAGFDDQSRAIAARLAGLEDGRAVVEALIAAYADWMTRHPGLAQFLFMAREAVAQGPHGPALLERLQARYGPVDVLLEHEAAAGRIRPLPQELIPALVLGATESYTRGWLAGRRQGTPSSHAGLLAAAAWNSLTAEA
jgi:AcrR family transcriptional regulator